VDPAFDPLSEQLRHVEGLPVPWYVAGGWAIDLFLGRVTRDHRDVDLAIARADQRLVYDHIGDRTWSKIVPHPEGLTGQGTIEPWDGTRLDLPVHQILADDADGHRIEFKAKHMREWDEADFDAVLPALYLGERHWLFHALEAELPRHPWMRRLGVT
jgi:hypothetical protein